MSSVSNVPQIAINSTGVNSPETADVLNGVLNDLNDSFGGNLNITNVATPQGYLAENLTYYITQFNADIAYLLSQFDPLTAEGRWQDAIGRLYYLTRKPATATSVTADLIGQPNVTLSAGALATDGTYNYVLTGDVVFGSGGTATGYFECTTLGAISCPANTLNRISIAQFGWDAINNTSAGVVGSEIESTVDFEYRRQQSIAKNASDTLSSIRGAVFEVADVIDVYAYENYTGSTQTIGFTNYPVIEHSIYVAVTGGLDADIAKAIWTKKSSGSNMNGNTSVTVYDSSSLAMPYSAYQIKFQRPTPLPIYFAVQIGNYPMLPSDYVTQVKTAIIKAFNGQDGGTRARIGNDIYASRFYAGIASLSVNIRLISVLIGKTSSPSSNELEIGIDQAPTIDAANITVTLV